MDYLRKQSSQEITVLGRKITIEKPSFGENRKIINQSMKFNMETKQPEIDASLLGVLRAISIIKDWDLTDESGKKLPISLDTFDNVLDPDFASMMVDELGKIEENGYSQLSEEEKKQ
ncbi:hypothetical protein FINN_21 [Bacillus phage Finn]|uniref:Tail assembly chaperone n=1 Tax=Bacillus phage Finn TaxID=2884419 RepID=M1IEC5_9CAUD|nr:hypothetical protein FINN_21 [Bacillus phage Finn]AGE61014.1 hypothetical protein FINN_21 [Bacillus phage Finn]